MKNKIKVQHCERRGGPATKLIWTFSYALGQAPTSSGISRSGKVEVNESIAYRILGDRSAQIRNRFVKSLHCFMKNCTEKMHPNIDVNSTASPHGKTQSQSMNLSVH